MKRFIFATTLSVSIVSLAACSAVSHRSASETLAEPAKPATPLDLPKDTSAEPQPAPPGDSAAEGPTVTLVRKDGTVIEPTPTTTGSSSLPNLSNAPYMPAHETAHEAPPHETSVEAPPESKYVPEWSYVGETGPDHWAELNPDYAACHDGKMQSPIDLKWHKPSKNGPLVVNYSSSPAKAKINDDGHTIQLNFEPGNLIKLNGHEFDLVAAHFHTPSEHKLSGKQFPLEMHLVNKDAEGKTVVLAVFFKNGKANAEIQKIWGAIPPDKSSEATEISVRLKNLMPRATTYYKYTGSLTAPPCTEGVEWIVYNNPASISDEQMSMFRLHYHDNSRAVQPLEGRKVLNY